MNEEEQASWYRYMFDPSFQANLKDFREQVYNFTFTFDPYGRPTTPKRPKIEVIVIEINGLKLKVPLNNEEVDALVNRGKQYAEDERRKAEQARKAQEREEYFARLREQEENERREQEAKARREREQERARAYHRNENDWRNGPYGYGPGGSRNQGASQSSRSTQLIDQAVLIEKLASFAQMDISAAKELPLKKLWQRAQRKCHPDTGGSHEKWLELHQLERYIS